MNSVYLFGWVGGCVYVLVCACVCVCVGARARVCGVSVCDVGVCLWVCVCGVRVCEGMCEGV